MLFFEYNVFKNSDESVFLSQYHFEHRLTKLLRGAKMHRENIARWSLARSRSMFRLDMSSSSAPALDEQALREVWSGCAVPKWIGARPGAAPPASKEVEIVGAYGKGNQVP